VNGHEDTELREPDTSLKELTSRLTEELGQFLATHVQLAKEEVRTEAKAAGRGAGMVGGGGIAAHLALLVLSLAAAWGLAEVMPTGVAFLIVGVVWAVIAAVLLLRGREELKNIEPVPTATIEEIQEDKQWLKKQP
jgi:hypothetical protein